MFYDDNGGNRAYSISIRNNLLKMFYNCWLL